MWDTITAAWAICKGRTRPIDIVSVLQPPTTRFYSFLSLNFGLISNLDIGTEHLRYSLLACLPMQAEVDVDCAACLVSASCCVFDCCLDGGEHVHNFEIVLKQVLHVMLQSLLQLRSSSVIAGPLCRASKVVCIHCYDGLTSCIRQRHAMLLTTVLCAFGHGLTAQNEAAKELTSQYLFSGCTVHTMGFRRIWHVHCLIIAGG